MGRKYDDFEFGGEESCTIVAHVIKEPIIVYKELKIYYDVQLCHVKLRHLFDPPNVRYFVTCCFVQNVHSKIFELPLVHFLHPRGRETVENEHPNRCF